MCPSSSPQLRLVLTRLLPPLFPLPLSAVWFGSPSWAQPSAPCWSIATRVWLKLELLIAAACSSLWAQPQEDWTKLSKSPVSNIFNKYKGWIDQISSILEEDGNRRASRWCTVASISFPKAHQPLSGTLKGCSSQVSTTQWLWLTPLSSAHSNGLHDHFLKVQRSWRKKSPQGTLFLS